MSYDISSDKFQHPLLKPILDSLTEYFKSVDVYFYVIGATARDIAMNIHDEKTGRATRDLDIAIAISNWDEYKTIEKGIVNIDGFEKDSSQKQRFIFRKEFELDIVPFGDIKKEDDKIFWPPDESVAMSVIGLDEVSKYAMKIKVDDGISINVASLEGVFLLKIVAWSDRNYKTKKDADDIAFILTNYLNIHDRRAGVEYYDFIYDDEDFSPNAGGAKLLGIDIAKLLKSAPQSKDNILTIIKEEINRAEESVLINQIIETNKSFKYDETYRCLKYFVEGLEKE